MSFYSLKLGHQNWFENWMRPFGHIGTTCLFPASEAIISVIYTETQQFFSPRQSRRLAVYVMLQRLLPMESSLGLRAQKFGSALKAYARVSHGNLPNLQLQRCWWGGRWAGRNYRFEIGKVEVRKFRVKKFKV